MNDSAFAPGRKAGAPPVSANAPAHVRRTSTKSNFIPRMSAKYTIGLDYGTNSVRALIVNTANGKEVATAVWNYEHGDAGVILSRDPNLARQHPADYVKGAEMSTRKALAE